MFKCRIPGWFHKECNSSPTVGQVIIAGLGSFIGIAAVSYLSLRYKLALLVPSFGASAVLLYAASHVPMAQPKNVLGTHLVSALIGVTVVENFKRKPAGRNAGRFFCLTKTTCYAGGSKELVAMSRKIYLHLLE